MSRRIVLHLLVWTVLVPVSAFAEDLGNLSANRFDPNSSSNPFGKGSPYNPDSVTNPFGRYGSPFSNQSVTNPYATDAPMVFQLLSQALNEP